MRSSLIYADTRCALGDALDESVDRLLAGRQLLQQHHFADLHDPVTMPYYAARGLNVVGQEQRVYSVLHDMLEKALVRQPLTDRQRERTGLFIGSSSFDVNVSELHYRQTIDSGAQPLPMPIIGYGKIAEQLRSRFGLSLHTRSFSTACTSSANAMLCGHRLLQVGVIDHALVLGMEFFNQTTLLGFHGLGLISPSGCMRPFDARRDGLILGEGCGLIMLSKVQPSPITLCGGAMATDNHSLTAANSDGSSIAQVMQQALDNCQLEASALAAIKVHGTASLMNDEAEAEGLKRLYRQIPPLFALKPYIGHTLGACGALEAALVYGCLMHGQLPANATSGAADDDQLGVTLLQQSSLAPTGYYGLNYFAFGGNNACLILHKAAR